MRKLEHQNIVKLKYYFYSSGDKVKFECLYGGGGISYFFTVESLLSHSQQA